PGRARSAGRRDPGGGRGARPDALAPSRPAPPRRVGPESPRRALHLLLRPAGYRDRYGPAAHRLLLRRIPMTPKVHVHMHVSDLAKSREFYRAFFGAAPVKERPGYVKFLPAWGPVNLALSQGGGPGAGPVDHLGVQVESTAEVMAQLSRIKS